MTELKQTTGDPAGTDLGSGTGIGTRLIRWFLPTVVTQRARVFGWLTLAGQLLLIGGGGAVRLTGSGLGCPTWPRCTADSLVNTPEMGVHGVIEFANRMLTFVLAIVVVVVFLMVVRTVRQRSDLFVLTLLLGLSIPVEAVIGGFSVLTGLNPYVVGLHFVVSAALCGLSAALVLRLYSPAGPRVLVAPRWFRVVAQVTGVLVAITIVVGILTTGSGPHAGDVNAPRNGLDSELLQHIHSWPAYAAFGLTIVLVIGAVAVPVAAALRPTLALLGVELVQIGVGLIQANTGLPGPLVGTHMVLAGVLAAVMVAVVMLLKQPAQNGSSGSIATARNSSVR